MRRRILATWKLRPPASKETLDLGDGGIYTLVLIADQETAEKELVLVEDRPSTEE